jgi:hypothetical protein
MIGNLKCEDVNKMKNLELMDNNNDIKKAALPPDEKL